MDKFTVWSKPKYILVSGIIMALAGVGLLFSPWPGIAFVIHVLGDLTIVFGIIFYVFPEAEKPSS